MDPRTQHTFEAVWAEIKEQLGTGADALASDRDLLWKWWPTLSTITPDYEMLSQALLNFGFNPYISLLTIFCVGYSRALDDIMEERVWPKAQEDHETRLPEWLSELVLEDLAKKFGANH